MTGLRKIVLLAAGALFLVWLFGNAPRIIAEDEGFIRFVLGLLFSALILLRWKPLNEERRDIIVYKVIPKIKLAGQEPIQGSANVKIKEGKLVATIQPVQSEPHLIASNVAPLKK